jgi:hypothetical protein
MDDFPERLKELYAVCDQHDEEYAALQERLQRRETELETRAAADLFFKVKENSEPPQVIRTAAQLFGSKQALVLALTIAKLRQQMRDEIVLAVNALRSEINAKADPPADNVLPINRDKNVA